MAVTVDVQTNPSHPEICRDADAVIIRSGITAAQHNNTKLVTYEIQNRNTGATVNIDDRMSTQEGGNLVDVDKTRLKIILPFRTNFRVRSKCPGVATSAWVNFTTRDKRYQSPDCITTLTDDSGNTAKTDGIDNQSGHPAGGRRTIVVTNSAKATERDDASVSYNQPRRWGSVTVTNTDTIYANGQLQNVLNEANSATVQVPVKFTRRGATVIAVKSGKNSAIRYTTRGATITTINT